MIDISKLRQAVEICKEVELDDKDIVQVFTVYNHLDFISGHMANYSRVLGFTMDLLPKLELRRKELIDKLKHDLRISNTQTNTNQ